MASENGRVVAPSKRVAWLRNLLHQTESLRPAPCATNFLGFTREEWMVYQTII